ncbi:MAG: hypothetical protein QNJ89_05345 [Acidimicrobiia bacterium]|nr:hypothetical protein [Acidimicrobiia bacterium]
MKHLLAIVALLTILVAGCRAEVRVLLEVDESGAGTLTTEVAINDQLEDLINQFFGADSSGIIAELDLGLEGTSETRLEGDMTVYSTEVSFSDETEVQDASAGNFTEFSLVLNDEGTSFEATLDLAGELDLTQFPVDPATIDPEALSTAFIVDLPGEPTEHNADEVLADGRLSWDIPFDGKLYVFADTEYPSGGFPWWLVLLLAISGGFALAVWLAAVRRDKRTGDERRAAPEPPPVTPPDRAQESQKPESPFFDLD